MPFTIPHLSTGARYRLDVTLRSLGHANRFCFCLLAPLLALPTLSHAQWLRTTAYNAGFESNPSGIVAGPDGALWVTQGCSGIAQFGTCGESIERITTSGATTTYSLPYTGISQGPTGITNGPDGALWFTESVGNKIGRITIAGAISEYAIPTANSSTSESKNMKIPAVADPYGRERPLSVQISLPTIARPTYKLLTFFRRQQFRRR